VGLSTSNGEKIVSRLVELAEENFELNFDIFLKTA
jgi:hypothetical protein